MFASLALAAVLGLSAPQPQAVPLAIAPYRFDPDVLPTDAAAGFPSGGWKPAREVQPQPFPLPTGRLQAYAVGQTEADFIELDSVRRLGDVIYFRTYTARHPGEENSGRLIVHQTMEARIDCARTTWLRSWIYAYDEAGEVIVWLPPSEQESPVVPQHPFRDLTDTLCAGGAPAPDTLVEGHAEALAITRATLAAK